MTTNAPMKLSLIYKKHLLETSLNGTPEGRGAIASAMIQPLRSQMLKASQEKTAESFQSLKAGVDMADAVLAHFTGNEVYDKVALHSVLGDARGFLNEPAVVETLAQPYTFNEEEREEQELLQFVRDFKPNLHARRIEMLSKAFGLHPFTGDHPFKKKEG